MKGEMEAEGTMLPSNGDTSCINVRRIRQAKRISLRKLAGQTKLSLSYLSNYENGKVNITVNSLKKIANVLEVPLADLLDNHVNEDIVIVPKEQRCTRVLYQAESGTALQEYLMYSSRAAMHVSINHLPPFGDSGSKASSHYGEEFIYCMSGIVTVILEDKHYQIPEGGMIYYRSSLLHRAINEHDVETVFLQVNTPPTY